MATPMKRFLITLIAVMLLASCAGVERKPAPVYIDCRKIDVGAEMWKANINQRSTVYKCVK